MCLSSAPARFADTILFASVAKIPKQGVVHVIGYQNTAQNMGTGPNCMMLPFQAKTPMKPENVVDTSGAKHILQNMADAIWGNSVSKGLSRSLLGSDSMSPVHVFDHDIYTIVLGRTDADLTGGLKRVVADRRPAIPADILKFWKRMYPGYHVAFCCFNNADARKAAPMLWWYKPADPQILVAPAIDGHDGKAPHPGRPVDVDHRLIASCQGLPGVAVGYSDKLSPQLSALLPPTVVGAEYDGSEANGDFLISVEELQHGDLRKAVTRGILPMAA